MPRRPHFARSDAIQHSPPDHRSGSSSTAAHPPDQEFTSNPDDNGNARRVMWNFETSRVLPDGRGRRFRPTVQPNDIALVATIDEWTAG